MAQQPSQAPRRPVPARPTIESLEDRRLCANGPPASFPIAISAIGYEVGTSNTPEKSLDGSLDTRWSQPGTNQWLLHKLPNLVALDHVRIAFYQGTTRRYSFYLQLSPDGSNWSTVFTGQSSGTTTGFETFTFPSQSAKFVRFVGNGNNLSNLNGVTELEIPQARDEYMIFKNGFEGTTTVINKPNSPNVHRLIRGNDGVPKSDWLADLESNNYIGFGQIYMETGTPAQREASVVTDPLNPMNKALRFRINEKHIFLDTGEEKARIQYEMENRNIAPAGGYLRDYYQKVRFYFGPDFSVLENSGTDNIGWFVLQEFRNDPTWSAPLAGGGFTPPSGQRNSVEIYRKNGKLHFSANGRHPVDQYPFGWEVRRDDFNIPLNTWITQEIYIREGDNSTGRFYMSVEVDGVKTVLVDKIGFTTSIAPGYVPDGQTSWNPLKVYTEGKVLDWFKNQNKPMDVLWDDLEVWYNKTPTALQPNLAPTVLTPAAATPRPVIGTTTALSVLGADDAGEPALSYQWSLTATPPAPVTFSANLSNAAKNTTATFTKPGIYSFLVTLTDAAGATATSSVTVSVSQTLTALTVSPANQSVAPGATLQYTATAADQFGQPMTPATLTWSTTGPGNAISSTGLFTASATTGGNYVVSASSGSVVGTAVGTVLALTSGPTLSTVSSRKQHGLRGNFDLPLALTGTPTIEPRYGGISTLIFTFSKPVIPADGALSANEFNLTGATFASAIVAGNVMTLRVAGIVNNTFSTVTLLGLTDESSNPLTGTTAVTAGSLYGDVTGDGVVSQSDVKAITAALLKPLSATTFLFDLDTSGYITRADHADVTAAVSPLRNGRR